ncbi:uncharacterized protein ALTATR162_LOCUS6826 [Alternaria atra]|uniref:Uncharacterized protein n=1 Tax=Alternaria atra TaxID=119953 RepID=A0A8J2I434_9PLEO|nr:uncharacterized protein ALTATR162_LOCUS6826 [Alternaria atra]CAG5165687.1 unnamed protein product [Alternaria atra]
MMSSNLAGTSGSKAAGGQVFSPTMDSNPPSTPAQDNSLTKLVEQRHDSLTKGYALDISLASSVPPGWKGSRIPSDHVPRKAPLAARSTDELSPLTAHKVPKVKQDRSGISPEETFEVIRANRIHQHKSFETPSGIPSRGRPRLDDGDGGQNVNAAGSLNGRGGYAQPPIGLFAPPQVSNTTTPPKVRKLRPQYSYQVPPELIGTKTALGPDNWDEYVYFMEQLSTENITAHEFDKRAKPIFQVFDERTRKKLNNIMATKMILPRLEELRERGQSTKGAEDV